MSLAAPKGVGSSALRLRKSGLHEMSEKMLALPMTRDASERKSFTIKIKKKSEAEARKEDIESDPHLSSLKDMNQWKDKHDVPPGALSSFREQGWCLKAMSLAQQSEVDKILKDAKITDKAIIKRIVGAVMTGASKDWLSELESKSADLTKKIEIDFPDLSTQLEASYKQVCVDIESKFSDFAKLLDARKKELLLDALNGRKEKDEFIESELTRFKKQLVRVKLGAENETLIMGDVSLSCIEKRDALCKMRKSLGKVEPSDEAKKDGDDSSSGSEVKDFVNEILVNGSILVKFPDLKKMIGAFGKIDNCLRPNTPSMIHLELFTHDSVHFTWAQSNDAHDSEVIGFDIDYCRGGGKLKTIRMKHDDVVDPDKTEQYSLIIDGLKHGAKYSVRIRAINVYGSSLASNQMSCHTAAIASPLTPVLSVVLVDKLNAKLTWTIVTDLDEVESLDGPKGLKASLSSPFTLKASSSSMLVHDVSITSRGRSDSYLTTVEMEQLTHFHIQYRKKEKKSWHSLVVSAQEGEEHTIEHLASGKVYIFRVRARNKIDWSDWSEAVKLSVPAAGPEEVRMSVVEHRECYSKAFHPSNLLKDNDIPYASSAPGDFEKDEADWVVFGLHF